LTVSGYNGSEERGHAEISASLIRGADRDAVGSTDTGFVPKGNDVGTDFVQQLECWVALFEQSSDRIARLEKQCRLALLQRLQKALSLF
jgi:hypothetical protein